MDQYKTVTYQKHVPRWNSKKVITVTKKIKIKKGRKMADTMGQVPGMPGGQNVFRPVYRELSDKEKEQIEAIKVKAQELYELYGTWYNREMSVAKTALEDSVMWAVKGITGPQGAGASLGLGVATGSTVGPATTAPNK